MDYRVGMTLVLIYQWTDMCLEELKWPTRKHHHHYYSILMLYSILHHSLEQHFQINTLSTRSHSLMLNSTINVYSHSFFVNFLFLNTIYMRFCLDPLP